MKKEIKNKLITTESRNGWDVVYACAEDVYGNLLFPEKITKEFLERAKRSMGSYIYANQYLNKIIPEELQTFRQEWFRYYTELPARKYTYAMIDPAIGQEDGHDYTGIVVIDVDVDANWYVRVASRKRLTPTEIIDYCFAIYDQFKPRVIGIETVAYQKALMYILDEEMKKRQRVLPVSEVHPGTDKSKEQRIAGVLVPRYEWGRIYHSKGLEDLEEELLLFPRASHDDLCDPLSNIESIITYPEREKENNVRPNSATDPSYEKWYIKNREKIQKEPEDY